MESVGKTTITEHDLKLYGMLLDAEKEVKEKKDG